MAIRTLLFLVCSVLLAREAPRTMATRKVINAKAFSDMRLKARESTPHKKKLRDPKKRRDAKSKWGPVTVRAKH